jgi:hypothetical protein
MRRCLVFTLLLAVALISTSFALAEPSSPNSLAAKHHSRGKILLESAVRHAHLSPQDKSAVVAIISQIKQLSDSLFKEEASLSSMKYHRKALKHDLGVWWWFKTHDRLKVAEYDMQIRDQERVVDNLKEDVDLHWKQLKPYFGVYSEVSHVTFF